MSKTEIAVRWLLDQEAIGEVHFIATKGKRIRIAA
jgi:hypothetical protein